MVNSVIACFSPLTSEENGLSFFFISFADVEKYFLDILDKDDSLSSGIAAIKTLLMVLEKTKCEFTSLLLLCAINQRISACS